MPTTLPRLHPAVINLDGWALAQLQPWSGPELADRLGFIVSAYLLAMAEDRPHIRDEEALLAICRAVEGWSPTPHDLGEILDEVKGYYRPQEWDQPPVSRALAWLAGLAPNERRSLAEALLLVLDHGDPEVSLPDRLRRMGVLVGS